MLEHIMSMIIPVILILLVLAVLAANIRVVPQSRAFVIERLGAFQGVWGVGLHFKIPFIERKMCIRDRSIAAVRRRCFRPA